QRRAKGHGPVLAGAVVGTQAMSGDGAEPATKRALPLAVEARQLANEDPHDLLHDVLGLVAERGIAEQPAVDQRPVEVVKAPPGGFVRRGAESLQEAGGGFHDGLPSAIQSSCELNFVFNWVDYLLEGLISTTFQDSSPTHLLFPR